MSLQIDIKKTLPGFRLQAELACEQGIIGILGSSGAGKSMLLKCIAGLVDPDEGRIIIRGKNLYDSAAKINLSPKDRHIGFLFQNYALFPHLTIAENILFGLNKLSKKDKHQKAAALMERFNLANMAQRYPAQISGGQQQRVALARALAVEPEILLLDEPFSALDNHLKNYLLKDMLLILKEFDGYTLFVTHNIEEAYRLCDRIAILKTGQVDTFGLKEEVFQKPPSVETARITGCKNITKAIKKGHHLIELPNWGIIAAIDMDINSNHGFAGIRANHIMAAGDESSENCFPVWIADESRSPFRTSLYLKIGSPAHHVDDYHLQWEISRAQRATIGNSTVPLYIYLDPRQIFFVTG